MLKEFEEIYSTQVFFPFLNIKVNNTISTREFFMVLRTMQLIWRIIIKRVQLLSWLEAQTRHQQIFITKVETLFPASNHWTVSLGPSSSSRLHNKVNNSWNINKKNFLFFFDISCIVTSRSTQLKAAIIPYYAFN